MSDLELKAETVAILINRYQTALEEIASYMSSEQCDMSFRARITVGNIVLTCAQDVRQLAGDAIGAR